MSASSRFRLTLLLGLVLGLFAGSTGVRGQADPAASRSWRVLLHSHADLAGGLELAENLQRGAAARDIDVIILTEQLLTEWQWAPPLIRAIWNYRVRQPSVRTFGVRRYFRKVAELDAVVPDVTLIAGTEVAPYYRWTGAPWKRDLSMWDWQRNILVLGLPSADDYARLPLTGLRRLPVQSVGDGPWLATLFIFLLLTFFAFRNRKWFLTVVLAVPAAGLVLSGPPPPQPFPVYRNTTVIEPYQALIDTVRARGGFSMWSQVEAVDDHSYPWGLIHTDPHPQVLLESQNYDAFGSIYPARTRVEEPGQIWDQVLGEYLAGKRAEPVWGWGELALHYPGQLEGRGAKRLDEVLNVVTAPERSEKSIVEALRTGRGYAVRAAEAEGCLHLVQFDLLSGPARATMGGTLITATPPRVRVVVSFSGRESPPVRARLIRCGTVVLEHEAVPPFSFEFVDPGGGETGGQASGSGAWYRLLVDGRNHRLVSNPIFVRYGTTMNRGGSEP